MLLLLLLLLLSMFIWFVVLPSMCVGDVCIYLFVVGGKDCPGYGQERVHQRGSETCTCTGTTTYSIQNVWRWLKCNDIVWLYDNMIPPGNKNRISYDIEGRNHLQGLMLVLMTSLMSCSDFVYCHYQHCYCNYLSYVGLGVFTVLVCRVFFNYSYKLYCYHYYHQYYLHYFGCSSFWLFVTIIFIFLVRCDRLLCFWIDCCAAINVCWWCMYILVCRRREGLPWIWPRTSPPERLWDLYLHRYNHLLHTECLHGVRWL